MRPGTLEKNPCGPRTIRPDFDVVGAVVPQTDETAVLIDGALGEVRAQVAAAGVTAKR